MGWHFKGDLSARGRNAFIWGIFSTLDLLPHFQNHLLMQASSAWLIWHQVPAVPDSLPRVLEAVSSPCLLFRGSAINNSFDHAILTAVITKATPAAATWMTTRETKPNCNTRKTIQRSWFLQKSTSWLSRDEQRDKGVERLDPEELPPHVSSGLKRWNRFDFSGSVQKHINVALGDMVWWWHWQCWVNSSIQWSQRLEKSSLIVSISFYSMTFKQKSQEGTECATDGQKGFSDPPGFYCNCINISLSDSGKGFHKLLIKQDGFGTYPFRLKQPEAWTQKEVVNCLPNQQMLGTGEINTSVNRRHR